MKLKAQLSGLDHEVSIDFNGDRTNAATEVDGRPYEVVVRELGKGQYLLLVNGRVCKARVENRKGARRASGVFDVAVGVRAYEITVIDPKRLRTGETVSAHGGGTAQIVSPMPGRIVKVLVAEGAKVEAGEGVVVVEAMKMQNELKAPKAGTVVSINAEVGATVSAGDVLAVIE